MKTIEQLKTSTETSRAPRRRGRIMGGVALAAATLIGAGVAVATGGSSEPTAVTARQGNTTPTEATNPSTTVGTEAPASSGSAPEQLAVGTNPEQPAATSASRPEPVPAGQPVVAQESGAAKEAYNKFIAKVSHPKVGDRSPVAEVTLTFKAGTNVSDGKGNFRVLTAPIDGNLNPAFSPTYSEICVNQGAGEVACVDIDKNLGSIDTYKPGEDHILRKVDTATALSRANAAEATVTNVEGDGFGYASIVGPDGTTHQGYFAARPVTDDLSSLPPQPLPVQG